MQRNALNRRVDFDTTLLREDKGHIWEFEQYEIQNLSSSSWESSSSSAASELRNYFLSLADGFTPINVAYPASTIENWAALQYGRVAPVVSEFSLNTFFGELREGLPRLIPDMLSRAKSMKDLGSDYLNLQFGWKPLLNDLQGLADSLLHASFGLFRPMGASHRSRSRPEISTFDRKDFSSYADVKALSGDIFHMSRYWPSGTTTSRSFAATGAIGIGTSTVKTSVNQWVEGEFVYIPKAGFDPSNFLDRYETLANVNITPAVLWELAPWSWLVDWAGQVGSSLSAMEAGLSDRVLSTYYYGMEDSKLSITNGAAAIRNKSGFSYHGPNAGGSRFEWRRRRRVRANPFGFGGSSSTTLNGSQMAILGALGLTRSK